MKNVITGVLVLGLAILHIWLGRIESPISYVSPILASFLFATYVGGFKGWSEPFSTPDPVQLGTKRANLTKGLFVLMTLALYGCSFIDRG